ncbi:hypothetical protein FQA39_LY12956 [Lamprigera yunnana]|nr:hypothetical protein FQA39_LY12956 [Lamprigera yunnana]
MSSLGELEEERRALYVALTRAEEKLFITYVSGEFSRFSKNPLAPSKFISELNKELYKFEWRNCFLQINDALIDVDHTQNNAGTVSAQLLNTKGYQKGDLVSHRVFGDGVIVNNNNGQLQIAFNNSSVWGNVIAANTSMRNLLMAKFTAVITDKVGLHARPASVLAKEASKYESDIKLLAGDKTGNLKSIMNIMAMAVKTALMFGIGVYLYGLIDKSSSDNNDALLNGLNGDYRVMYIITLLVFTVFVAPLFEEITYRHGIFAGCDILNKAIKEKDDIEKYYLLKTSNNVKTDFVAKGYIYYDSDEQKAFFSLDEDNNAKTCETHFKVLDKNIWKLD